MKNPVFRILKGNKVGLKNIKMIKPSYLCKIKKRTNNKN
jgi:hypothetical protein